MSIIDYIREKNKIFENETGIVLVPEEYIVEVSIKEPLSVVDDVGACPYCEVYYREDCEGCPLVPLNGVYCDGPDSTYGDILSILDAEETGIVKHSKVTYNMQELVDKFNKELGEQGDATTSVS